MADASLLQHSFLGGEWSKFYQGRSDRPDYRTALNVCFNYIPIESGALVRRPGFGFAGTTRGGAIARVIKFDYSSTNPAVMEFTNGHLRFWFGTTLFSGSSSGLSAISTANPAVITLSSAVTWQSGGEVYINGLGVTLPLLQNRRFTVTRIDSTHFSLFDSITGASIDGTSFTAPAAGAVVNQVFDLVTLYGIGHLPNLRSVQTDNAAILLHPSVPPQELIVIPTGFMPLLFQDGPYLDPFINGAEVVPNQTTGIVQLTLQFPAWLSTTAYSKGAFVTSATINYESLVDQNIGNTPVSSPSQWQPVAASSAINGGQGLLSTDIGRLIRLYSEPAAWLAGSTYSQGNVVSYNPTGIPGAATYWQSLTNTNTGNIPGTELVNWELVAPGAALPAVGNLDNPTAASGPAQWTWGRIVSISSAVPNNPAGIAYIGNMTGNGGLSAAFNGTLSQPASASAAAGLGVNNSYVGENFSACTPATHIIQSVTIYPSSDEGLVYATAHNGSMQTTVRLTTTVTISLYASNSPPASYNNGTLLGQVTLPPADIFVYGFGGVVSNPVGLAAATIQSTDTTTAYAYVWVVVTVSQDTHSFAMFGTFTTQIAQVQFISPPGTGTGPPSGYNVELLGPPLLYTQPIITWRMGLYSNTTGWPSAGTYAEGRLWLTSQNFPNRIDASVANGINGVNNGALPGSVNFAPTDQYGNVTAANAIDYSFNAPDANPIFWMVPDQQGILCGTKAGEWLVNAPTSGGISPLNIAARRVTRIGCANIEPRQTEHTLVFVQKFLRKIMEFFPDVFSGKFTAPHITEKSKHLTQGNIAEIAYQQELAPIVWARVGPELVGWTYKRDTLMTSQGPTFAAGHRHTLGSGRMIESIAVGPSVGGNLDALTIITNDPATGIRHVEVLSDIIDEGSALNDARYLDDAVEATSSTSSNAIPAPYGGLTLNGLWHLNGKTVTAWLGGLDCGDYLVTNGSITVPYGDGVPNNQGAGTANGLFTANFIATGVTANGIKMFMPGFGTALVGFTYPSIAQIVRPITPAESGARSGPAFGKMRRAHQYAAQLEGTGTTSISFGTDISTPLPALFRQLNDADYTIDLQFNGIHWNTMIDQYSRDGAMLGWVVSRPYIANVVAVGEYLETQD